MFIPQNRKVNNSKIFHNVVFDYPRKEYLVGNSDVKLGEIGGVPFYMNDDQYEKWKHTDLTIDAVQGIGGMFSLDNGTGRRFLTKSEICLVVDNDKKN